MKYFPLIIFCALCFFIGVWLCPSGVSHNTIPNTDKGAMIVDNNPVISSETKLIPQVDQKMVGPMEIKKIVDIKLKPSIDTDHPENLDSTYKQSKKIIIDAYNAGYRDEKTIQSFLYLSSLENNQKDYKKAAEEWCKKKPDECIEAKMSVVVDGKVVDEKGGPVVGVNVFVSGEEDVSVKTDTQGYYRLSLVTLNPRRIRVLVQHPEFSGGSYTFSTLDPRLNIDHMSQIYHKDFTLQRSVQKVIINTSQKKVISGDAQITKDGYLIENSFSKYLIPFNSIRTPEDSEFRGEVTISVFEFNRKTANEFLQADVFSPVYSYASEGLATYSMPLIFFYDKNEKRLEVFKKRPMTVWTTNRELQALMSDNAEGKHQPGFDPTQYEEALSPENVKKYIIKNEQEAYEVSQKNPDLYPITLDWIYKNYSRLPGFFVYDQSTGLWENVGYSLEATSTDVKHSIRSLFWTKV